MTAPVVSVVIPARNGAARLPETLASISRQHVRDAAEVIVVDDGSSDGTAEVASRFVLPWGPPRVVRRESPGGRAAACNAGIEAARSRVVVLLDDDMTLRPEALQAHAAYHAENTGRAARGRVVLAPPERETCFARFLAREEANQERQLVEGRHDLPFPLCQTGHFSVEKETVLAAGGLDTSITRYGFEDIDLGFRLRERGVRLVYLPAAESVHRAYITDLDRYLARHREAGIVARQLADRHPGGPFREYLRVDGPGKLGIGRDPAGLVALRVSNRLLLRAPVRHLVGSALGFRVLLATLQVGEALRLDRAVHFGYHVARDIRYFQGYFGEGVSGAAVRHDRGGRLEG